MHSKHYFISFRRALFVHGVMGQPAARLIAELHDHLALKRLSFQQAGEEAAEVERKACAALGEPHDLAARAAETLQQGSWMARHPVFFGLIFGLAALAVNLLTVVAVTALCLTFFDSCHREAKWVVANVAVEILNWLPILLGFAALGRIAHSRAIGWRSLLGGAAFLVFFTCTFGVWSAFHSATPGLENSVSLTFNPVNVVFYNQANVWCYGSRLLLSLSLVTVFYYVPLRLANIHQRN